MNKPLLLPGDLGAGVKAFTSTRVGGMSTGAYDSMNLGLNTDDDPAAVRANRSLALQTGGADPARAVYLQQVHGDVIHAVGEAEAGRGVWDWAQGLPACDAAFTKQRRLPLAIGHADCLAVVLADPANGIVGVAHAGWRGALAQLPGKLAWRLQAEGAQSGNLKALLSPCLGPRSLELSEEQYRLFQAADSDFAIYCSPLKGGHFMLDLWTCARLQLEKAGLSSAAVQVQAMDTSEHTALFYSHRRDRGVTGRMLTVAWLE